MKGKLKTRWVKGFEFVYGDSTKKGIVWDDEPTYCPGCDMYSFKTGTIMKKRLFGYKRITTVTFHKAYSKGYTDKKGNHYCGKCNHIIGGTIGIKIKETKEMKKARKDSNRQFRTKYSCKKCGKYIFGYEYFEIYNDKYCTEHFKEMFPRDKYKIEWW